MRKLQLTSLVRALIFALLCAPTLSFACIWIDGTTLDGLPHRYSPAVPIQFLQQAMDTTPQERLETLRSYHANAEKKSSEEERQAVEAMLSGNPQAAVSLLLEIERTTPGEYSTAANLGTAYELAGDNENALKWITEGIARNTGSHGGTEWLHQEILETKIRLATAHQYLASHRVIPLPEEFDIHTRVNVDGSEYSVMEIAQAISYQLRERMVFIKPSDPIVADLLFTFAQIEAQTGVVESALPLLEKAKSYGFADPILLGQTAEKYQAAIQWGKAYKANRYGLTDPPLLEQATEKYQAAIHERNVSKYTVGTLLVLLVTGGFYFLFRKRRFTRAANRK